MWLHAPIVVTFSEPVTVPDSAVLLQDGDGMQIVPEIDVVDTTLTIQIGEGYAGFGTLDLALGDSITDLAGNPLAPVTLATWNLDPWARPTAGLDRATGPEVPDVAVDAAGIPYVAWTGVAPGGRRIYVSRIDGGVATALGSELGAQDSAIPSLAFDSNGRLVVAWTQFQQLGDPQGSTIQVARWDGIAWTPVPSPGAGTFAWMNAGGGGEPTIAWVSGSSLKVSELLGETWGSYPDIAITSGLIGVPSVVVTAPGRLVVGFVDGIAGIGSNPVIRTLTGDGNGWTEAPAISLGTSHTEITRMSLAANATDVVVAHDIWNGHSYGVQAWSRSGAMTVAWQPLGEPLDIDPPANAQAPAIALDATGVPIVAWRERVESQWRGFAARWSETAGAWEPIAGDAWNDDPSVSIVRPRIALWRGRVPVIAWGAIANGAMSLGVAQLNGPAVPRPGIPARVSIAGCSFSPTMTRLSQTGCFPMMGGGKATPHPGLIPFDLRSELWSDAALKRRWIALPDGQMLTAVPNGPWTAPVGTMLIKEFAIETSPGNGATRTIMETRFLVNTGNTTWDGFSYQWRADGSDADLLPDAATTVDWTLDDGTTHTHSYPSRAQCNRCHNTSVGPILGLKSGNLARRYDYDGIVAGQLETFMDIGIIASSGLGGTPYTAPHDAQSSAELRVRGYLAANCAHCHNPQGERPTRDFRWETPLAQTMICGVVTPGNPSSSLIYQRVSSRPGMPPLATLDTDPMIIDVLGQWITSISACP
jgi:hypothetical protein